MVASNGANDPSFGPSERRKVNTHTTRCLSEHPPASRVSQRKTKRVSSREETKRTDPFSKHTHTLLLSQTQASNGPLPKNFKNLASASNHLPLLLAIPHFDTFCH